MKHQPNKGLFDEQDVLAKPAALNDLLPRLGRMIGREAFRPVVEKAFPAHDPRKGGARHTTA